MALTPPPDWPLPPFPESSGGFWLTRKLRAEWYRTAFAAHRYLVAQLKERPPADYGSDDPVADGVKEALSRAIAAEKGISAPLLQDDDQLSLLFWGVGDDDTSLAFVLYVTKSLRIRILCSELKSFITADRGVAELVEFLRRLQADPARRIENRSWFSAARELWRVLADSVRGDTIRNDAAP